MKVRERFSKCAKLGELAFYRVRPVKPYPVQYGIYKPLKIIPKHKQR